MPARRAGLCCTARASRPASAVGVSSNVRPHEYKNLVRPRLLNSDVFRVRPLEPRRQCDCFKLRVCEGSRRKCNHQSSGCRREDRSNDRKGRSHHCFRRRQRPHPRAPCSDTRRGYLGGGGRASRAPERRFSCGPPLSSRWKNLSSVSRLNQTVCLHGV